MAKKTTFEQNLAQLEQIVDELESQEMELDAAIKLYEKGVKLSQACQAQLEESRRRIAVLHEQENDITEELVNENAQEL